MSNGVNFRKLSLDLRDQLNQVTAELNTLKHPMNSAAIARKERDALQQRLTKAEEELDLLQAQAVNDTEANTAIRAEREALQLLLNNRDDQLTSLEQRRYAEQQAREAAARRVVELESERATLRDALLIYSGQHERSDKVGHIEMLDIAQAALNWSARKPEQSGRPIVAWALTFNGEFNSGWISAGASKASAEGMRDNYISVCRPCNLPKLALVPLTAALNPTAEAVSHDQ